jgi:ribosomal protein S18 acetylase RimI-like enzyme
VSTVHTRLALLGDAGRVAPLFDAYRQFYAQPAGLARATQFLQDRLSRRESLIVLATLEDGAVVGFCPIYTLSDLFVSPSARRLGVGGALLQAAERLAADRGVVRLELTTAHTNQTAQALYESLGWCRDEVYRTYTLAVRSQAGTAIA